jgi:hypothetical protein
MPPHVFETIQGLNPPTLGCFSNVPLGGIVSFPMPIGPRRRATLDFALIARTAHRFVAFVATI